MKKIFQHSMDRRNEVMAIESDSVNVLLILHDNEYEELYNRTNAVEDYNMTFTQLLKDTDTTFSVYVDINSNKGKVSNAILMVESDELGWGDYPLDISETEKATLLQEFKDVYEVFRENDFDKYCFVKTDESIGQMNHNEYYFKISNKENLKSFMKNFNISLDDFDISETAPEDKFCGLDFQVSEYSDGSKMLDFGPVFKIGGNYTTVDVVTCEIDGLLEYLVNENHKKVIKIEMRFIKNLCYQLYKVDWLKRISYEQKIYELKSYYEGLHDDESVYSFEDYLEEFGYDGEIYACFDEFLENEFQDKQYMESLLNDEALYKLYLKELGGNKNEL